MILSIFYLSLLSLPPSLYLSFYLSFSLSLLSIILFGVSNGRFRRCYLTNIFNFTIAGLLWNVILVGFTSKFVIYSCFTIVYEGKEGYIFMSSFLISLGSFLFYNYNIYNAISSTSLCKILWTLQFVKIFLLSFHFRWNFIYIPATKPPVMNEYIYRNLPPSPHTILPSTWLMDNLLKPAVSVLGARSFYAMRKHTI